MKELLAREPILARGGAADDQEGGQNGRGLHHGGDRNQITLEGEVGAAQHLDADCQSHRRDRAIMGGDGGGIDRGKAGGGAQNGVSEEGQDEGEDRACGDRQDELGCEPLLGDFDPAFEANRHHQIDRQALGNGFRDGEIGSRNGGEQSEGKEQNNRGEKIAQGQIDCRHASSSLLTRRGAKARRGCRQWACARL